MVFKAVKKWTRKAGKNFKKVTGINPVMNKRGVKNVRKFAAATPMGVLGGALAHTWKKRRKK